MKITFEQHVYGVSTKIECDETELEKARELYLLYSSRMVGLPGYSAKKSESPADLAAAKLAKAQAKIQEALNNAA